MFPDICAPSPCSGPSPATFGLQLGEEGGQRKDKVSSRVSSARSPIRLGRSAFSSRVDAPPGWSAIPAARLALLPLPPPRAWPGFRSLNNPSSNCDDGGDSSWEPGLSHPPPWPSPACPRAPWPERNVEPSPVPSPSWPLSAVSVQRHACARVRLYPYELRVRGEPGQGACNHCRNTLPRKEQPRTQITETGRRNNYREDQSTPAVPSRPTLPEAAGRRSSISWRRRPLAGRPTAVGYTHRDPGVGRGWRRGRAGVDQSRTPVHRQTAGGANGREAPVLSPTSGPRLPPYTMAPKEGPHAARPK